MARELSERDIRILKKLAPECGEVTCGGSGHAFQSILPPVSNHFAESAEDFENRLARLDRADLDWLADRILDGSESLGCVQEEDIEAVVQRVREVLSPERAEAVLDRYLNAESCDA
jgi:DNA-binding Lrp family transcriptional regulator